MQDQAMAGIDWGELFGLSMPALELVIRGSVIYWFLFLMFRFVLRRDIGSIGITDVLFVVIIADAAQNAMAGEYKSITDGFHPDRHARCLECPVGLAQFQVSNPAPRDRSASALAGP